MSLIIHLTIHFTYSLLCWPLKTGPPLTIPIPDPRDNLSGCSQVVSTIGTDGHARPWTDPTGSCMTGDWRLAHVSPQQDHPVNTLELLSCTPSPHRKTKWHGPWLRWVGWRRALSFIRRWRLFSSLYGFSMKSRLLSAAAGVWDGSLVKSLALSDITGWQEKFLAFQAIANKAGNLMVVKVA